MAEVEEECLASAAGWYKLPEDTREEILAFLPLDCLCKSRSVCKEWNALFSSTRFITNKWAQTPSNKNPWLLLSKVNFQMGWKTDYSAYCFFTRTWKTFISFSFLPEGHKNVKCSGAAEGLFLVDIPDGKLTVCNPLTRAFLKLPSMSSIKNVLTKGIVGWRMDTQQTYKVVAVGLSIGIDEQIVEIYDSDKNSWRVAGYLPENLEKFGLSRGIVFCDGCFYGTTVDHEAGMGVLEFNILEGTSNFTPLPELANGEAIWPKLLTCESRILLVGGIGRRMGSSLYTVRKIFEVILWEFHKDSNSPTSFWKEIARMPPSLCENFRRTSCFDSFDCVGVGNRVCFTSSRCMDVAVYSLSEETWSWLPASTTMDAGYGYLRIIAFKPRPDIKIC